MAASAVSRRRPDLSAGLSRRLGESKLTTLLDDRRFAEAIDRGALCRRDHGSHHDQHLPGDA